MEERHRSRLRGAARRVRRALARSRTRVRRGRAPALDRGACGHERAWSRRRRRCDRARRDHGTDRRAVRRGCIRSRRVDRPRLGRHVEDRGPRSDRALRAFRGRSSPGREARRRHRHHPLPVRARASRCGRGRRCGAAELVLGHSVQGRPHQCRRGGLARVDARSSGSPLRRRERDRDVALRDRRLAWVRRAATAGSRSATRAASSIRSSRLERTSR